MICPEPLAPGSRIRVIAPASPFDRTLALRGMGWLAERYRVEFDPGLFQRDGFLAGTDARRLDELNRALQDPRLGAIVAARGGYGSTRVLRRVDFAALRRHPKWLVGFSDITALHMEAARFGLASLHAQNAAELGRSDARVRNRWIDALENPLAERAHEGLEIWNGGRAHGPLAGGNLTVLFACAAANSLFVPEGAVLLLEDVTETSYRIDRMLTALLDRGLFDRVAAVIVGDFHDCSPGKYGVCTEVVLRERLSGLRLPVLRGYPSGHGIQNDPVHLGLPALVDGVAGRVTINPRL